MDISIKTILIVQILLLMTFTNIISASNDYYVFNQKLSYGFELDQYQNSDGNIGFIVGYYVLAQSFKPSMTPLVKVDLYGYDNISNSPIDVSIREDLFGEDLTMISVSQSDIPSEYAWFECDFPDIEVEPEKTYYIVVNQNGEGKFTLRGNYGNDYYSRGNGFSRQENTQDWVNLTIVFPNFDYCFKTYTYGDNLPPDSPIISGPTRCPVGVPINYTFSSNDFDGDKVLFKIDWGDDTITEWIGPVKSEQQILLNHTWDEKSSFTIQAQSKDIYGDKSEWITLNVRVSKEKNGIFEVIINRFLHHFPYLNLLLEKINY